MSEDTTSTDEKDGERAVGGELLRQARREHDISIRDVAKELHLDERKVRALEKNEFDLFGAPVFAKGHLRKYAEIVGVDVDDVMTDYYQMNRSSGTPPVVGLRPSSSAREIDALPWIGAAVAVLVVLGGAFWWFSATPEAPSVRNGESLPAPVAPESSSSPGAGIPAAGEPDVATADTAEQPVDAPAAGPELPAAAEPPAAVADADPVEEETDTPADTAEDGGSAAYTPTPGAPQVSVTLSFSGECWTEVTDSSGQRLFYALGRDGRVVNLSGDAPLRLVLGDADSVSVAVEGRPWPIPASARRGQLARLTIPAQ